MSVQTSDPSSETFPARLLGWYDRSARALPWRIPPRSDAVPDPYRVWMAEIMLQQTTVAAVAGYALGVREGLVVKAGDPLGYVGDTGNAGAGNYHLHFGVALTTPEQRWHEGTDIDPYPLLAGKTASS